jgi:diguanylate cyclase (GGDEF)-like protein
VNAAGQVAGVLHSTGPDGEPPSPVLVEQLVTLSSAAGARLGAMRTLASTQLEAATDPLTGLANRRSLEAALQDLLRTSTPFVLVLADLDHFKLLNDNFGHELGDRALQLFSDVLKENARGRDIVARFGGEEFVIAYPEMDLGRSMEVLGRIQSALRDAVAKSGLPTFTASFGVSHSSVAADLDSIIRVADAGLLTAKELGRDQVVFADEELAIEVFDPEQALRYPRDEPSS